jgi:hypothetical protein
MTFLAEIIQYISVGIISHTAASVNSDDLSDDIAGAVQEKRSRGTDNSYAYRISRSKLQDVYQEMESDMIANRIIKLLVLTRLYMFKTTESDMQWIARAEDPSWPAA